MNIDVTFHIVINHLQAGKKYKMLVQHFYSTDQIERFKITAGEKELLMEKHLNVFKQPWKITSGVNSNEDPKKIAWAIMGIQDAIDNYLDQRDPEIKTGHIIPKPPKNKYGRSYG